MTPIKLLLSLLTVVIILLLSTSLFIVKEGQSALVLRLGKIITDPHSTSTKVFAPGLHVKFPFVDSVRIFDMRMQELATPASQPLTVVTKEQTYLVVEYFAKWRIDNLSRFYTSTGGSVSWAETLLEQRLNDIVRAEYGKRTSDQAISLGRSAMMSAIKEQANAIGRDQGIHVIDVRIQQITLPKDVMDSVFNRMATERKQFAEAKRAEGIEKSEEIRALADQRVTVIKAEAIKKAASIRAQGAEEAAELYASAYNTDLKFYTFYRSLEAYVASFSHKTDMLVLKPNGQFFNYFYNSQVSTAAKR